MAKAPKPKDSRTWSSKPDEVDAYMGRLRHPLIKVVAELRKVILKTSADIGEEIKWNAPSFFFTGKLPPSDPKEYARYLIVFNLFKKDCVRLVFWRGAAGDDGSGFLQGDYADGRRLATFRDVEEVTAKTPALRRVLRAQLKNVIG